MSAGAGFSFWRGVEAESPVPGEVGGEGSSDFSISGISLSGGDAVVSEFPGLVGNDALVILRGLCRVFERFFCKGRPVNMEKVLSLNSCTKNRDSMAAINISLTFGDAFSFSSISSRGLWLEVTMNSL